MPSGTTSTKIDMATSDLDTDNIIVVTEANHREEQKQAMERDMC